MRGSVASATSPAVPSFSTTDQSPCASHTYDFLEYHPGTNSFVQLGSTSNQSQGGGGSPRRTGSAGSTSPRR